MDAVLIPHRTVLGLHGNGEDNGRFSSEVDDLSRALAEAVDDGNFRVKRTCWKVGAGPIIT